MVTHCIPRTLDNVAANLSGYAITVSGIDYTLTTDAGGVITLVPFVVLGGTAYCYASTIANGNTLYTDSTLTTPAASLTDLPINLEGTDYLLSTDESGVITLVAV